MKEQNEILDLIKKAKDNIEASELLFVNGFLDVSASRSYYSMFYATEALLLTKNLFFSKHKAVIAAFGKEFIKTKVLPQKLRDYLVEAFDKRQMGDYGSRGIISKDKAKKLLDQSIEFIEAIEEYLKEKGYFK